MIIPELRVFALTKRHVGFGNEIEYGVVYLAEGDWFLVLSFCKSLGSFVGAMLEPFERPPHNFVFASNICPTSVQLLLNECWSNVETV